MEYIARSSIPSKQYPTLKLSPNGTSPQMPLPANLHFVMTTASCLTEHRGPNGSQWSQRSHVTWHPMALRYCRVGLGRRGWGMSENRVYSQWNSHLIGIMISKTIGYNGVHDIFRHTQMTSLVTGVFRFLAPNPRGFRVPLATGGRDHAKSRLGWAKKKNDSQNGSKWMV